MLVARHWIISEHLTKMWNIMLLKTDDLKEKKRNSLVSVLEKVKMESKKRAKANTGKMIQPSLRNTTA